MPKTIKLVLTLILLLVAVTGLVAINPGWVARPVLQSQLAKADFRLVSLETLRVGTANASTALLRVDSPAISLSAANIRFSYSLRDLLSGKIAAITIDSLELNVRDNSNSSDAGNSSNLSDYYALLEDLPLAELNIEQASIRSTLGDLDAHLNFQFRPLKVSLNGQWRGAETLDFIIASQALADRRIQVSSSVSQGDAQLFEGEHEVELTATELTASGRLSMNPSSLQTAIFAREPQDFNWAVLNNRLLVDYRMSLHTGRRNTELESFLVSLHNEGELSDGNSSSLQIQGLTSDARFLTQIGLPLSLSITPNTVNEWYGVALSDSYQNFSWYSGENQMQLETNLSDFQANCETWNRCMSTANFQLQSPVWEFFGASGENTTLSGELEIELLPELMEITGNDVTLNLEAASYDQWHSTGGFEVDQVFLMLGEVNRGRLRLHSNKLNIDGESLSLVEPAVATNINFFDDALAGSFDLALGMNGNLDAPLLHSAFNHSLSSLEGQLELNLNETELTELEPLSGLLRQQMLNMDVVAGKISATGQLNWTLVDDEVQLDGPAIVYLDGLSGHIEDTLLVGVSTEAQGQFRSWSGFIGAPNLSAHIDVVDIGLPLRNVQWQYNFNTADQEILISELNAELFDGKVEIADFRVNPDNLDQDLTLVLSRMDLENIVELAGYPQLFVDGLISGYIPITLADGRILVNDGLVGALKPGGSIRYTPAASTNANPSMQLVNEALSNYQYETLDTRVFYDENGDLRMEVQLQGINPDMNGGQPINLNVNVTDNIPSLLRSLKAGQEISERLEQRLQSQ